MASALAARLARIEEQLAPAGRMHTVYCTVVIRSGAPAEQLPIPDEEWNRVREAGFRDGVDDLVVIKKFIMTEDA